MIYRPLTLPDVTQHIDELYKIWGTYQSSSIQLEINYYEQLKHNLYAKR
jgi:hypothetical protein